MRQLVRAVDIPVRGVHGVFDAFESEDIDPAAFADRCKTATSTSYGTAGPEFVRRLIAENVSPEDVRERVEAFVRSALRDVKDRHGQAARVAQRFRARVRGGRTRRPTGNLLGSRATR